jgi:hypothetical protein
MIMKTKRYLNPDNNDALYKLYGTQGGYGGLGGEQAGDGFGGGSVGGGDNSDDIDGSYPTVGRTGGLTSPPNAVDQRNEIMGRDGPDSGDRLDQEGGPLGPQTPTGEEGGGGGSEPDPWAEFEALDKRAAELMLEQYEDYKKFYAPIADDITAWAEGSPEEQVRRSRDYGQQAGDVSSGILQRNLDRYGIDLGYRHQSNIDRNQDTSNMANTIQTANTSRQGMIDLENAAMQDFIGIGHGVQSAGLAGITNAANLSMQQQMAGLNSTNQLASQNTYVANPSTSGSFLGGLMGGI